MASSQAWPDAANCGSKILVIILLIKGEGLGE
jgi:hypothetical protein